MAEAILHNVQKFDVGRGSNHTKSQYLSGVLYLLRWYHDTPMSNSTVRENIPASGKTRAAKFDM
jgi:hypothetical protein